MRAILSLVQRQSISLLARHKDAFLGTSPAQPFDGSERLVLDERSSAATLNGRRKTLKCWLIFCGLLPAACNRCAVVEESLLVERFETRSGSGTEPVFKSARHLPVAKNRRFRDGSLFPFDPRRRGARGW